MVLLCLCFGIVKYLNGMFINYNHDNNYHNYNMYH
jgi:hypothetical protein